MGVYIPSRDREKARQAGARRYKRNRAALNEARRRRYAQNPYPRRAEAARRERLRQCGGDHVTAAMLSADLCAYCTAEADSVDHIESVKRGGATGWQNLTAACGRCNSAKRDLSLLEFLLKRRRA